MVLPDYDRVRELTNALDEAVPRDGRVVVKENPHERGTVVRANELGYLRLGIEFLKGAFESANQFTHQVELDLVYLTGVEEPCYTFERIDVADATHGPVRELVGGLATIAGCVVFASFGVFIMASFVVGALRILAWILGALSF